MKSSKLARVLFGEKTPDINDPAYRDRYERGRSAGERFARVTRLDKLFARIQAFAGKRPKLFLGLTFGFVILVFVNNIVIGMVRQASRDGAARTSVVERQDSVLSIVNNQTE